MTSNELTNISHQLLADLGEPDMVWQVLALAACLLLAKLGERALSARRVSAGRNWELGRGGLMRIAFPLLALALVLVLRTIAQKWMHISVLSLAVPLLFSLAVIRVVFYVLRLSFVGATWLARFEQIFAMLVWGIVALHITGFLPDVIGVLESVSFNTGKQELTLWQVLQGIAAVLATILAALWLSSVIERRLNEAAGLDGNLRVVFARLAKALLVLLAVLIGLPMVGIDLTTLSVFGGALGVGLGFGLQKIASNYVSGFVILAERSLRIGDMVKVDNFEGRITDISTRYTVIRALNGREAIVPNEMMITQRVENSSLADTKVALNTVVQVAYGTDLETLMPRLATTVKQVARVLAEPGPSVMLSNFAADGLELTIGFWVADPENGQGNVRGDVNLAILRTLNAAGVEIPFPQRVVRQA